MTSQELHIAEIGEYFINLESFDFLSQQNLHEYDFIVMDSESLIQSFQRQSLKNIEKRINDLKGFIGLKNIPVPIFLSSDTLSPIFGKDDPKYTICKILGLDYIEESASGRKIEIKPDTLFTDILRENIDSFEYQVCFSIHPGISIGNAKSKNISVGFYTQEFVFLPGFAEDNNINEEDFLKKLYELCRCIRKQDTISNIPTWANNYFLPGEKEEKTKLKNIINSIAKLEKDRLKQEEKLLNFSSLKLLWTATGFILEKAVKQIFVELGFIILESASGREDLIMKWKNQIVIAEVKGLSKSAAEKNAAQLEKWVSTYISEKDSNPKGLLIVNTFREIPIDKRMHDSFPPQMLPYSKNRNHCLLTTLQLCCLLLFIRKNPAKKDAEINKLLTTIGQFKGFTNWQEYISTNADYEDL